MHIYLNIHMGVCTYIFISHTCTLCSVHVCTLHSCHLTQLYIYNCVRWQIKQGICTLCNLLYSYYKGNHTHFIVILTYLLRASIYVPLRLPMCDFVATMNSYSPPKWARKLHTERAMGMRGREQRGERRRAGEKKGEKKKTEREKK